MIITQNGIIIRTPVKQIRSIGRATQGVKLINLDEGDLVIDVARVVTDRGSSDSVAQPEGSSEIDNSDPETANEDS
jgi:DNA gyrase subunit A